MKQELIKYDTRQQNIEGDTLHSLSIESATNEKYLFINKYIF